MEGTAALPCGFSFQLTQTGVPYGHVQRAGRLRLPVGKHRRRHLRGSDPANDINRLPEDIQEQINAHAEEFRTEADIREFVEKLAMRA